MKTQVDTLETLFHEKIMLYQDLVECLRREREILIKNDIDALWEVSGKKESIVSRVEALRNKMLMVLSEAGIDHGMDVTSFDLARVFSLIDREQHNGLHKAYSSLVNLKGEIRRRSQENKLFVEECLDLLDDLIGILANTAKPGDVYDNNGVSRVKGQANLLLHREV